MGVAKRTRKFAQVHIQKTASVTQADFIKVKRIIGQRDSRLKKNASQELAVQKKKKDENDLIREIPQVPSSLFFQANQALVPPYSVIVDTNFVSHTVRAKLDMLSAMMDLCVCLLK